MLPHPSVLDVLEAAFRPCPAFGGPCAAMRWLPALGHVPRGFAGALGNPSEVRLVLVTSEPGDPHGVETYPGDASPREILEASCRYAYSVLEAGTDLFHRNLRYILDLCWPGQPLTTQLRFAWLTDSVLCSAEREAGKVLPVVESECRKRYLEPQLRLFSNALVVAVGGKALQRLRRWPGVQFAYSVAPPGYNMNVARARASWQDIANHIALPNTALQQTAQTLAVGRRWLRHGGQR